MKNPSLPTAAREKHEELCALHPKFIEALRAGPIPLLPNFEERKYQRKAWESMRENFLAGEPYGQVVIGMGGGKTFTMLNFIAATRPKTLYTAPSNLAIDRAIKEIKDAQIPLRWQIYNGGPVDPDLDILFCTTQMLLAGQKHHFFAKNQFALVVSDEAHHSMGEATRTIFEYFDAFQLYMTATPATLSRHLDSVAKLFFQYTPDNLIEHENYPPWVLYRYEIHNEQVGEIQKVGADYHLGEGEESIYLNMPERYAYCLKILREVVAGGRKAVFFLPSVSSSRHFVDEIVAKIPELKGRVAHVDGAMKNAGSIIEAFSNPEASVRALCSKKLLDESVDVPGITDIILADPCASPSVLYQRIGRGARKAPGKDHLKIHDLVSVFDLAKDQKPKSVPLTVAGTMGVKKYVPGLVLNGSRKDQALFEVYQGGTKQVTFRETGTIKTEMIPLYENLLDFSFMRCPDAAKIIFLKFAQLFRTHLWNLVYTPEEFYGRPEQVGLLRANRRTEYMTFAEAHQAVKIHGDPEDLERYVQQNVEAYCQNFRSMVEMAMHAESQAKAAVAVPPEKEVERLLEELRELLPVIDERKISIRVEGQGGELDALPAIPDDPFAESRLGHLVIATPPYARKWPRKGETLDLAQYIRAYLQKVFKLARENPDLENITMDLADIVPDFGKWSLEEQNQLHFACGRAMETNNIRAAVAPNPKIRVDVVATRILWEARVHKNSHKTTFPVIRSEGANTFSLPKRGYSKSNDLLFLNRTKILKGFYPLLSKFTRALQQGKKVLEISPEEYRQYNPFLVEEFIRALRNNGNVVHSIPLNFIYVHERADGTVVVPIEHFTLEIQEEKRRTNALI